jgi:hypothetical protein
MENNSGYSDLDLSFNPHPVTGDLMITTGDISVIRALKNLLLTNPYEKPFNPDYGSNIRKLLFEPMTAFTGATLQKEIEYTVKNYERRVTLKNINVTPNYDNNSYNISIEFYIENLVQLFSADFLLTRLR